VIALLDRSVRTTAARGAPAATPLGVAGRGAVAGLVATALLSVLARVMPGMRNPPPQGESGGGGGGKPALPEDPFDRQQVHEWQNRADSPAAYRQEQPPAGGQRGAQGGGVGGQAAAVTPAGALAQAQAPGPEGAAAQFALKLASGMFGRDIRHRARLAGEVVHFTYGTAWGVLYGLLQGSSPRRPGPFGLLYGLVVWLVGPALLVPAMKVLPPPAQEPPLRLAMMVAGHLIYGLAVAVTFEALEREAA
jgi:hypothetical protein